MKCVATRAMNAYQNNEDLGLGKTKETTIKYGLQLVLPARDKIVGQFLAHTGLNMPFHWHARPINADDLVPSSTKRRGATETFASILLAITSRALRHVACLTDGSLHPGGRGTDADINRPPNQQDQTPRPQLAERLDLHVPWSRIPPATGTHSFPPSKNPAWNLSSP